MEEIYYRFGQGDNWKFWKSVDQFKTDYEINSTLQMELGMVLNDNRKVIIETTNKEKVDYKGIYSTRFSCGILEIRRIDSVDRSRIKAAEEDSGSVDMDEYINNW